MTVTPLRDRTLRHYQALAERAHRLTQGRHHLTELLATLPTLEMDRQRLYRLALGWLDGPDAEWLTRRAFTSNADPTRIAAVGAQATLQALSWIHTEQPRRRGVRW